MSGAWAAERYTDRLVGLVPPKSALAEIPSRVEKPMHTKHSNAETERGLS